jgi:hypothetical protein
LEHKPYRKICLLGYEDERRRPGLAHTLEAACGAMLA